MFYIWHLDKESPKWFCEDHTFDDLTEASLHARMRAYHRSQLVRVVDDSDIACAEFDGRVDLEDLREALSHALGRGN